MVKLPLGFLHTAHEDPVEFSPHTHSSAYLGMIHLRDVSLYGFAIDGIRSLSQFLDRLPAFATLSFTECDMPLNTLCSLLMLRKSFSLLYLNRCCEGELEGEDENMVEDGNVVAAASQGAVFNRI